MDHGFLFWVPVFLRNVFVTDSCCKAKEEVVTLIQTKKGKNESLDS
jgi:hypothetical protein